MRKGGPQPVAAPRKPDAGHAAAPAKAFVMADVGRKIEPLKPAAKPTGRGTK